MNVAGKSYRVPSIHSSDGETRPFGCTVPTGQRRQGSVGRKSGGRGGVGRGVDRRRSMAAEVNGVGGESSSGHGNRVCRWGSRRESGV